MGATDILAGIESVITIAADGDAARGRVMLVLVRDGDRYRWYGTDDGREWADSETSGDTVEEAEMAAATAWSDPRWDLQWPWNYEGGN